MNKSKIQIIALLVFSFINVHDARALNLPSFSDVDLSNIKYENRVRVALASGATDDFSTSAASDINGDGSIDFLEEFSFSSLALSETILVGNAHTRYALENTMLWLGVAGEIDAVTLDGKTVLKSMFAASSDAHIVYPHPELVGLIDYALLIDLETGFAKRDASKPISDNGTAQLTIDSVLNPSVGARMYIAGYGAIKSGFNSVTPSDSDAVILLASSSELSDDSAASESTLPVPEPMTAIMLGTASACGLIFNRRQKKPQNRKKK